jgi:hypothetical protein
MKLRRPFADAIRWVVRVWIACLGAVFLMRLAAAADLAGQTVIPGF